MTELRTKGEFAAHVVSQRSHRKEVFVPRYY